MILTDSRDTFGAIEGFEGYDYSDVNDSDLAIITLNGLAIWINVTRPATISYYGSQFVENYQAVPNASFTVKRLASSTLLG